MLDKDPSQMTDEELDAIVGANPEDVEEDDKSTEGDDDSTDDLADEEDDKEIEEDEDDKDDPGDDALIEEDHKAPSRREQLRIRDILAKRSDNTQPAVNQATERLDYAKELNADPELIKQLEDDRAAAVRQAGDLNTSTAESIRWDTRLRIDAQQVFKDHPELDKRSENFNPRVSDALNEFYLDHSGFDPQTGLVANPNTSYADFTDAMYELAREMAGEMVSSVKDTRKSNRAKTGIRPGGSTSKKLNLNQAPENMSDEELDAYIAQNVPTR